MVGKRIAALGAVLLLASACSRPPIGPTTYSALPAVTVASISTQPVTRPVALDERNATLPSVAIPGTSKVRAEESGFPGVNPTAVLEASMRTRMAWRTLHPADLLKPPALAARSVGADVAETGATSVAKDRGMSKPASTAAVALTYNREAKMDRLVKEGRAAATSICSGC